MPGGSSDPNDGTVKRSLPSWTSSKGSGSKSGRNKKDDSSEVTSHVNEGDNVGSLETSQSNLYFSKLLEGVVFVLSGFVNPERSTLRSQALEMGAEYRADWTSDCTLLVCAFPNTPKFRQVESDCGTIVSKEWISECYNQKRLVDIERFLMHAGKPWRKNNKQHETNKGQKDVIPVESRKKNGKKDDIPVGSGKKDGKILQGGLSHTVRNQFSPSKIKEWATDDLNKTVSWLESQEEKPEACEIKTIAAEGINTCLQDAIESLKQNKDIRLVMDQWMFVPRVVKELSELEGGGSKKGSLSKDELSKLAITCKMIYESEFDRLDSSPRNGKKQKTYGNKADRAAVQSTLDDSGFDSDQTIEMSEEEIELACRQLSSSFCT